MLIYFLSLIENEIDKAEFASLYEQYERKMYAIAFRILKNVDDAFDAEFAMWERVAVNYSTAKEYLSKSLQAFESWITVIVKNQSKDELRRRRRAPLQLEMWDISALSDVETESEYRMTKDTIRSMPDESRRIIEMHHFQGCTFKEIGIVLGCSKDTAKRRYERAIRALREQMKVEQV